MVNNKKSMSYYIMWVPKSEEDIIRNILNKEIKTEEDLALLGDILSRINAQGNFKLG